MSETGRSRGRSRHRHHQARRHSRPPSPPDSDVYFSDNSDSLASRDGQRPPRHHSTLESKAIVVRDQYQVQAPPRAHRRDDSPDEEYEYTVPREHDAARARRQDQRRARQKKEGGVLVAVALFAASVVFCMDWCADE